MDEKRSEFQAIRVGPPLDPSRTKVHEVWFPGAHADVGGGYGDSNDLAGLTLDWMLDFLRPKHVIRNTGYRVSYNVRGILHHPEGQFFNSFGSSISPRVLPDGAVVHPAFLQRARNTQPLLEQPNGRGANYEQRHYRPDLYASEKTTSPSQKPRVTKLDLWLKPSNDANAGMWKLNRVVFDRHFKLLDPSRPDGSPSRGTPISVMQMQVSAPAGIVPPSSASAPSAPAKPMARVKDVRRNRPP